MAWAVLLAAAMDNTSSREFSTVMADRLEHCCGGAGRGLPSLTSKLVLDAFATANGQLGIGVGFTKALASMRRIPGPEQTALMERRGRQAFRFGQWLEARLP